MMKSFSRNALIAVAILFAAISLVLPVNASGPISKDGRLYVRLTPGQHVTGLLYRDAWVGATSLFWHPETRELATSLAPAEIWEIKFPRENAFLSNAFADSLVAESDRVLGHLSPVELHEVFGWLENWVFVYEIFMFIDEEAGRYALAGAAVDTFGGKLYPDPTTPASGRILAGILGQGAATIASSEPAEQLRLLEKFLGSAATHTDLEPTE